jgi:hypothetical protein
MKELRRFTERGTCPRCHGKGEIQEYYTYTAQEKYEYGPDRRTKYRGVERRGERTITCHWCLGVGAAIREIAEIQHEPYSHICDSCKGKGKFLINSDNVQESDRKHLIPIEFYPSGRVAVYEKKCFSCNGSGHIKSTRADIEYKVISVTPDKTARK